MTAPKDKDNPTIINEKSNIFSEKAGVMIVAKKTIPILFENSDKLLFLQYNFKFLFYEKTIFWRKNTLLF